MTLPRKTQEWIVVMGTFLVTALSLGWLSKAAFGIAWVSSLPIGLFLAAILSAAWCVTLLLTRNWLRR